MRVKTASVRDQLYLTTHHQLKRQLAKINPADPNINQIDYWRNEQLQHCTSIDFINSAIEIKSQNQYHVSLDILYQRLLTLLTKLINLIPNYNMNQIRLIYDCDNNQLTIGHYHRQIFYQDQPVYGFQKLKIGYYFNDLHHFLSTNLETLVATIESNNQVDDHLFYQDLVQSINQNCSESTFSKDNVFRIDINKIYLYDQSQIILKINLSPSQQSTLINLNQNQSCQLALANYLKQSLNNHHSKLAAKTL